MGKCTKWVYYAELIRVDVDTATLTAILDNEKIIDIFGEDFECLKVTARLDKIQDNTLPPVVCVIILQTDVDNVTNVSAEITTGANSFYQYSSTILVTGDVLNQTIGVADGSIQDVTYTTDECDTITDIVADGNEWIGGVNLTNLDSIETIRFVATRQTDILLPTANTNAITSLNLTRSDFVTLDLTDVNIGGDLRLGAITQIDPVEPLNSLILPLNNNNIWTLFEIFNSSLTSLDLSEQNNLGGSLRLLNNLLLTNLILGSSNEVFTKIQIDGNSLLIGNLDLSGYPNVLNLDLTNNNLDSLTFANATSLVNGINGDNNNFASLDFTSLGNNFTGEISFQNNIISSLLFVANSQLITRLDFSSNNISSTNLNVLTNISGFLDFRNNSFTSQSDFNFPTIPNVINTFLMSSNLISGIWDFTSFMSVNTISGVLNFGSNNITEIIYQSSNLNVSFNNFENNNINTILDLSPLSNSSGVLDFANNNIPSVILPSSSNVFTQLRFNNNNVVNFDITPLTGANNSINPLRLNDNDMTTLSMDSLISDLDSKGWINGNLFLNAQSTAQQPTISALAYISLLGKGWIITI